MKKIFFTTLIAIVAICGAFSGRGKSTSLITAGILNDTKCDILVQCFPGGIIPCRIDPLDPISEQLYMIDTQQPVGKCNVYLGYL